ncbi:RNA-binding protein, putative [Entamoeba invadens IP1]|uniref:RNA-binding protein, putative n=1 Tax=Entamoeba invadens IP1 TaxID=370355 RepID=A0A0A1TVE7_ENTIV|nr:RNA-binding protein, putative [Entamoeba invadens IP1]ELP84321.1 RNA-binding protein, putative [Entamoeba invadens IP1]|eukprot:XP_004183667.1 RNA-binding protein, putative [Entamoeba invadens IP1]
MYKTGRVPMNLLSSEDVKAAKSDLESLYHFQYGEHPSRVLYVKNIPSDFDRAEVEEIFQQYGDVKGVYWKTVSCGFIFVTYYDIRASRSAAKYINGRKYKGHQLEITFGIPNDVPWTDNHATLVVFNAEYTFSVEDLKSAFGEFGEMKEIREAPSKKQHKFIEYFDSRSAEAALKKMDGVCINGKKMKVENSKPNNTKYMVINSIGKALQLPSDIPAFPAPPQMVDLIDDYIGQAGRGWMEFVEVGNPVLNKKEEKSQTEKIGKESFEKKNIRFDDDGNVIDDGCNTLIVKNISRRCTEQNFVRKVENAISTFYKEVFLFREASSQTGVVIVSNVSAIKPLYDAFNDKTVDKSQEVHCEVFYAHFQDEDFVQLLENMLVSN